MSNLRNDDYYITMDGIRINGGVLAEDWNVKHAWNNHIYKVQGKKPDTKNKIHGLRKTKTPKNKFKEIENMHTHHSLQQKEGKNVTNKQIYNAFTDPLVRTNEKIDRINRPSYKAIGTEATIGVNPKSKTIPTAYVTGEEHFNKALREYRKRISKNK